MSAHVDVDVIPQEARPYQGQRAGIVSRILASVIDAAVIVAILLVVYLGVAAVQFLRLRADFRFPTASFAVFFVAGSVTAVLYFTVAWAASGRTYGDHVLGLRVVNGRGRKVHPAAALARAILCVLFPVLLLWVAVSRSNRSVQDVVLRTSVVYDWRQRPVRAT